MDLRSLRPQLVVPAIAAVTLVVAAIVALSVGIPLRDPSNISVFRGGTALVLLVVVVVLEQIVRRDRRIRWTWARVGAVAAALVSFYITYFAYRNLKSVVPVVRPGALFDADLAALDRNLFGGTDPGKVLHDLLGQGLAAYALAELYMGFFLFIPIVLAVALGAVRDLRIGLFIVAALALTWLLGAVSYYILPSLGPFHEDPATFAGLPVTSSTRMQHNLMADRTVFLQDPSAPGAAQSVGAFASLHVAIFAAAATAAVLAGAHRALQILLWILTALTAVATIYFGWHFLADDAAGLAIGVVSAFAAAWLVGIRQRRSVAVPVAEPA